MPISVACQACRAQFNAPSDAAGKTAKCPKCGSPIPIPAAKIPLATERQKEFARELGIAFSDNINRREISKLIDDAVAKRDDERFSRLNELEHREALIAEGCRISEATTSQIIEALYDRGVTAVLITMQRDDISDFSELKGVSVRYSFTDDMTQENMESVILTSAASIMNQRYK